MVEERVYKLENGKEKILMATIVYKNQRYLLLSDDEGEEVETAYEKDGNLIYIDEDYPEFDNILELLYNKLKDTELQ